MPAVLQRLAAAPTACAALALFAMMTMTFADVVLRSAFNAPIEAAAELTRILMAIIVFSVLPMASFRGAHITVDLLDPLFPPWAARLRDGAISLICGGLLIWPATRVFALADRARGYGDVTEYLGVPQHLIAYGIAGFTCLTVAALALRGVLILIGAAPPTGAPT